MPTSGAIIRAAGGKTRGRRDLDGIGSLRGAAQRAERRLRGRGGAGARPRRGGDPAGPALVSRPGAPHGAGRPQGHGAVRQRFQGDQRRFRGAGAGLASPTCSGSPAASRRPAASPRSRGFFPRIRKAYLIGEAAAEFAATLDGKVAYEMAGTLERAVAAAARDAAASGLKEPVVLLSPACASFDQYRNFEVRGDALPRAGAGAAGAAADQVAASESRPRVNILETMPRQD